MVIILSVFIIIKPNTKYVCWSRHANHCVLKCFDYVDLQKKNTDVVCNTQDFRKDPLTLPFQDIRFDLEKNQPRVMSLRDTADQLLKNSESPEMSQAKDKMHIIANRLKALLRLCSSYITSLESRLDAKQMVNFYSIPSIIVLLVHVTHIISVGRLTDLFQKDMGLSHLWR